MSKVTSSLTLKTLIPDINKSFYKSALMKRALREEIIDTINSGISPVKGKSFKDYSPSYAKKKGKKRPVDMLVTGKMLRSLKVFATKSSFRLAFTDKVAQYHNDTGRVIRRLLPSKKGERFKPSIEKLIRRALELAASKSVKKQNRS